MDQVASEFHRRYGYQNDRRVDYIFDIYMQEMTDRWEDGEVHREVGQNGRVRYDIDVTLLDRLDRIQDDGDGEWGGYRGYYR
jgi:hypothetical protein